jgi:hypothetical protein
MAGRPNNRLAAGRRVWLFLLFLEDRELFLGKFVAAQQRKRLAVA